MKEIEFRINQKTGQVKIEAKGYQGQACMQATARFEKLFGPPAEDQKKPEYYEQEQAAESEQAHQGGG